MLGFYKNHIIHAGGQVTLEVGQHSYPFTLKLPSTIPSSYEGSHGHIRYILKSEMLLGSPKSKHTTSLGFRVNNQLDLNLHPLAKVYLYILKIAFSI